MLQIPSADLVQHIHERITELKNFSSVVDVEEILKSLRSRYPDETIRLEDVAQYVFNAASFHDVGLALPGQTEASVGRKTLTA